MPNHNHNGNLSVDTGGDFGIGGGGGAGKGVATNGVNNVFTNSITVKSQGGGGAHNNIQPSTAVNYVVSC